MVIYYTDVALNKTPANLDKTSPSVNLQ